MFSNCFTAESGGESDGRSRSRRRPLLPVLGVLAAIALTAPAAASEPASASAASFSNPNPITSYSPAPMPECGSRPADSYPSTIAVSGLSGTITDVNVTLNAVTPAYPDGVGILLVGPADQSTILMQDSGGVNPVSSTSLTFDDAAAEYVPDLEIPAGQLSRTYKPTQGTNSGGCAAPSSYPGLAPAGPYGKTLGVFNGTNPNGEWSLYVIHDTPGNLTDPLTRIAGWSLDITVAPPAFAFGGFAAPIDIGELNSAKAGQTIPVKWHLEQPDGTPVSDPASFTSLTSQNAGGSCSGQASDAIETYTSDSGLQYLGDGDWQYNWKTPKAYTGQCRTMTLTLSDDSTHTASFQFK